MGLKRSDTTGTPEPSRSHGHGVFGMAPGVPVPLTPLVGRDREIEDILTSLLDPRIRLMTLTGPGGIGKTRLALAVAARVDDAVVVPLATISDPAGIAAAILQALGRTPIVTRPDAEVLLEALAGRHLLMVLDNAEHLLPGASLLVHLLGGAPELTILATSRTRLGLSGERIIPVEPLDTPDPSHLPELRELAAASGVRLFVERARAIDPTFVLTERNAVAVATICQRLDGLPLAIELAAPRAILLTPKTLAQRLERRLELLTGGPWDSPARHRTMHAAIDWSYGLLSPAEQRLFRRLAVFEGGTPLGAIETITTLADDTDHAPAGDVINLLSTLVDHNLVIPTERATGETRVAMAGVIREFAQAQLAASGEDAAVRDAHAAAFLDLAIEGERHLVQEVDPAWLDRLETDHANFRAALAWTLRDGGDQAAMALGARLAGALWLFWYYHSHLVEGRAWLERALAMPSGLPDPDRARVLLGLGTILHFLGEPERAREVLVEGVGLLRALGDISGTAYALTGLGTIAEDIGRYDGAEEAFTEASRLFAEIGDQVNVAVARYHLGVVAVGQGDVPRAIALLEDSLARSRQQGDPWNAAATLSYLGLVRAEQGETGSAGASLAEALSLYRQLGTTERIVEVLRRVAVLATARRDAESAVRLFAAADAHGARIGIGQGLPEREMYARARAVAERLILPDRRASVAAQGAALTMENSLEIAARQLGEDAQHRGAAPVVAADPSGLSPREQDVLRLMVEGASNDEIASALNIARRTAAQHVAAILGKLGASNRTAATTIALRRGLV